MEKAQFLIQKALFALAKMTPEEKSDTNPNARVAKLQSDAKVAYAKYRLVVNDPKLSIIPVAETSPVTPKNDVETAEGLAQWFKEHNIK